MDIAARTNAPRIAPLDPAVWETGLRERMLGKRPPEMGQDDAPVFNIFRTLAHHPKLATQFAGWAGQLLLRSTLPAREREIAVLRVGWLCRATYEWQHHVAIGRDHAGLSGDEIERIKAGPNASWSSDDRTLLTAVDELLADHFISEETWGRLSIRFSIEQLIDLVFLIGNYTMISMALNSFGVALEPEFE